MKNKDKQVGLIDQLKQLKIETTRELERVIEKHQQDIINKAIKSRTEREPQNTNSTYNRTDRVHRLHHDRNGIIIKVRDTVQVLSNAKSGKIGDYARVIKLGSDRVTIKLRTTGTTRNRISSNLVIVERQE